MVFLGSVGVEERERGVGDMLLDEDEDDDKDKDDKESILAFVLIFRTSKSEFEIRLEDFCSELPFNKSQILNDEIFFEEVSFEGFVVVVIVGEISFGLVRPKGDTGEE